MLLQLRPKDGVCPQMQRVVTQSESRGQVIASGERNPLDAYLAALAACFADLKGEQRTLLMSRARAEIELDTELEPTTDEQEAINNVLSRLGEPAEFAARLRTIIPGLSQAQRDSAVRDENQVDSKSGLAPCRTCGVLVSKEARTCPHCGAPNPVISEYLKRAYGYEWKSKQTFLGYPLVHVAFGRDKNGKIRVAKGVIAIGQFGIGVITVAQFGIAYVLGIGQFMLAPIALGQFALGLVAIGQFGIGALFGMGQFATGAKAIGMAPWLSLKR